MTGFGFLLLPLLLRRVSWSYARKSELFPNGVVPPSNDPRHLKKNCSISNLRKIKIFLKNVGACSIAQARYVIVPVFRALVPRALTPRHQQKS